MQLERELRMKNETQKEPKKTRTARTKPEKVHQFLTNPMSTVYLLFLERAIHIFDISDQILQKEEPCIHILLPTLELQLQKVLLSLCKPENVITMMDEIGRGIKPTLCSTVQGKTSNLMRNSQLAIRLRPLSKVKVNYSLSHSSEM